MKILRGFVQGVLDKGTSEKPYALVGISDVSKNRNGFEESSVVEFMVSGEDFKRGLHNAYRQLQGSEVYAPYADRLNVFNGKTEIRYDLQGAPLRIVEQAEKPAASPSPVRPAASA